MTKVIQIRDVPDDVHEALARLASANGLSLNRYVLGEFEKVARTSRNAEVFARAARRKGKRPSRDEIVAAVREGRELGA